MQRGEGTDVLTLRLGKAEESQSHRRREILDISKESERTHHCGKVERGGNVGGGAKAEERHPILVTYSQRDGKRHSPRILSARYGSSGGETHLQERGSGEKKENDTTYEKEKRPLPSSERKGMGM